MIHAKSQSHVCRQLHGNSSPKRSTYQNESCQGDTLYLVEGPDGYTLTPYQQDFKGQMEAAEGIMKRYKNTLRELAK